jgi:hypothetical protein
LVGYSAEKTAKAKFWILTSIVSFRLRTIGLTFLYPKYKVLEKKSEFKVNMNLGLVNVMVKCSFFVSEMLEKGLKKILKLKYKI